MNKPVSIIIADSHKLFADAVEMMLKPKRKVLIRAKVYSSQELLDLLDETASDVLLADLELEAVNSPEGVRNLRAKYPLLKILITSADVSEAVVEKVKGSAVHGFISKVALCDEMYDAIRSVHKGERFFPLTPDDFSWIKKSREAGPLPTDHTKVKPGIVARVKTFFDGK